MTSRSIRSTLLLLLLAGVAVVTAGAGFLLHARARDTLVGQFDAASLAATRTIMTLLEEEDGFVEFDFVPERMPEFGPGERAGYFELWTADGRSFARSPSFRAVGEATTGLPRPPGTGGDAAYFDVTLPDGREGRAAGVLVDVPRDVAGSVGAAEASAAGSPVTRMTIVVARGRAEIDAALAAVRGALLIAGFFLLAAVTVLVLFAVRRGLAPLVELGRQVERIDATSLSRRLDAMALPVELRATAEKLNELLARLDQAFERERRMTANVAHELRTPLAELRAAVDVALRWPDDAALQSAALETARAVSMRMGGLVAGLMRLARVEAGAERLQEDDVDLRELVESLWPSLAPTADERGLRFDHSTPPGLVVRGDRELLSVALANLLDNALRFAERDSTVTCGAETDELGTSSTWWVENRSETLRREDLARLTEPFWQKDVARGGEGHAGLGLALVATVAEALGMTLDLRLDETFKARLSAPLRGPARRAGAA